MELKELFEQLDSKFGEKQKIIESQKSLIGVLEEQIETLKKENNQLNGRYMELSQRWNKIQKAIGGIKQ